MIVAELTKWTGEVITCEIKHEWIDDVVAAVAGQYFFANNKEKFGIKGSDFAHVNIYEVKDNEMKDIGHERKKKFKAMVFSLLMDFKNGHLKRKSIDRVKQYIELYSCIDPGFVQRTIAIYEEKLKIKLQEVLNENL